MCISTEIASVFPVPILYTTIQKINDICVAFLQNSPLVGGNDSGIIPE